MNYTNFWGNLFHEGTSLSKSCLDVLSLSDEVRIGTRQLLTKVTGLNEDY